MATALEKKWKAIGMNPPSEGDSAQAYQETVQNMIRAHSEALDVEMTSDDADYKAEAKQRAKLFDDKLKVVSNTDVEAAMTAIEEAAKAPQVIAAVGEEIREEGT